jgi:hypothetical protein
MSLTISLPPEMERQLQEAAARDGLDASSLALKILLTNPSGPAMSDREAELVAQIHRLSAPQPLGERRRYERLRAKNRLGALAESEREQLFTWTDAREQQAAERLGYLGELARLREQSVLEVMASLGLKSPGVV